MRFFKMHGLGNDFVVLDHREGGARPDAALVRALADRRRGIGCDQLVVIEPCETADARLVFFNADGSEASACGNATRCVAGLLGGLERAFESAAGTLRTRLEADGRITAMLSEPLFGWREVPLARPADTLSLPIDIAGLPRPQALSMGNPHCVFFVDDLAVLDVETLGSHLERHALFPERANIGFAQLLDPECIRLRVFERGAGLTPACGSGACAALVAAVRRGLVEERATLVLDGGELEIAWPGEGPVAMTGPWSLVFEGSIEPERLGL